MKAFPTTMQSWDIYNGRDLSGMDLRDYFAAKAMQGLLSTVKDEEWQYDEVAAVAYEMADVMMKEREPEDNSHEVMAAALMMKKEREECAKLADECVDIEKLGDLIRARGKND